MIAFDLWQTFFNGAPDAIGRTLRFGRTYRTIVGVMPEGFLYPYREHFWLPLQTRAGEAAGSRRVIILGRLAPGVSAAQAQTELTAVDRPAGSDESQTSQQPRVRLTPAPQGITDLHPPATATGTSVLYFFGLLLVGVTCGNVATLTLARGAARSTEIAVRRALGAGRGRIILQLFVESLVLAIIAGALGLAILEFAASRAEVMLQRMPYWFDVSVQPFTVAAAAGLALFSAFVAGVLPALKLTSTHAYLTMQRQAAGATVRFGLAATLLIVVEVGIAVGGLSGVASVARGAFVNPSLGEGLVPERYLTAELRAAPPSARIRRVQSEVARLLAGEGDVQAMSFAIRVALGARPAAIARGVMSRALLQLFSGVALGAGLGLSIVPDILNKNVQASDWRQTLAAVAAGMVVVGLVACAAPTRRALRIQPIDALKDI